MEKKTTSNRYSPELRSRAMIMFINDHRDVYGVESICRVLPIAPSTYYSHLAYRLDPTLSSVRQQRDAALRGDIHRVWEENYRVYGVRKVWRQLKRETVDVARCTVERLMVQMGLRGVIRWKVVKRPPATQQHLV
jgi:putative transposase